MCGQELGAEQARDELRQQLKAARLELTLLRPAAWPVRLYRARPEEGLWEPFTAESLAGVDPLTLGLVPIPSGESLVELEKTILVLKRQLASKSRECDQLSEARGLLEEARVGPASEGWQKRVRGFLARLP
jgi:hypothetical protein